MENHQPELALDALNVQDEDEDDVVNSSYEEV